MDDNYEIFKKHPDGIFVWVESAKDLQAAKQRPKQLAARSPGEYLAVRQETRQVVATESSRAVSS